MTPAGFQLVDHPGRRVWARPEAVPWSRWVLEGGQTLHGAAGRDRTALRLEGRRPVFAIEAKVRDASVVQGGGRWAVRHYARGGRVFRMLGDRYFRVGLVRPLHELRASQAAVERGIPTPRVVAAAVYTSGPFYRGDIVTEFVPGALGLAEALFDTRKKGVGGAVERQDALRAAGELIRRMAEAGIRHKDIHAGNILLEWRGAAPRPHLLDLDRCEIGPPEGRLPPQPMIHRLRRSLRRWESRTGLRVSEAEWRALESAAMG